MPSVDESQNDTTTSKDVAITSNANSIEPSPGDGGINQTSDKSQNDLNRQFNMISGPPPPPPNDPKASFSSNIVITPQRTVNTITNHEFCTQLLCLY